MSFLLKHFVQGSKALAEKLHFFLAFARPFGNFFIASGSGFLTLPQSFARSGTSQGEM
jgi:hypothetical protein